MKISLSLLIILSCLVLVKSSVAAGKAVAPSLSDADHDGLSDADEDRLLAQFLPTFMVNKADCSTRPAQFVAASPKPEVVADDGTIYSQATPWPNQAGVVELHYFHLWRRDCGEMGHALDTEHISALIDLDGDNGQPAALYWYAAAHEDTICDASQITRASTISAEIHGPVVWISSGKHASFFTEALCSRGCGGDRCEQMEPLHPSHSINLGEWNHPMNAIAWLRAPDWPLEVKMRRSDFSTARLERLERLPQTDVMWANPSKRPAQAGISGLHSGIGGAAAGARSTDTALVIATGNTDAALGTTYRNTTNKLNHSKRNVLNALRQSARKTGEFLKPKK